MQIDLFKKSVVGEVKLSYYQRKEVEFYKISNSREIEAFIRTIFPTELINHREYAYAIFLDRANNILGYFLISIGGISGTMIDPRIVFQAALLANSSSLVLFHNHPSSNLQPSKADIEITKRIAKIGRLLDISLLDHIIITEDDYYSFADEGAL